MNELVAASVSAMRKRMIITLSIILVVGAYLGGCQGLLHNTEEGRKQRIKNGKEIWEGDICSRVNHRNSLEKVEVKFIDGAFYPDRFTENNTWLDCNSEFYNKCEVLGNIYENPDLLK